MVTYMFPNFKPGVRVAKYLLGANLDKLFGKEENRENVKLLLKALGIENQKFEMRKSWRKVLNEDRSEYDLVILMSSSSKILHIETKGGKYPQTSIQQFKRFKQSLNRKHGNHLENISYHPILAKGYSTRGSQICKKHSFNFSKDNGHSIEDEEFN